MVVKALSDPNHDREMEVKIDGSHFVTFSIAPLVLPPLPCSKGKWKYCNVCSFDRVDCFKDIIPSFNNPVKESIFFLNDHVPERLRSEDRLNAIVSFEKRCVPKSDYRSSFPAHVGHHHVVKCVGCDRSFESCAMEYGRNRSDSVLKLYSLYRVY